MINWEKIEPELKTLIVCILLVLPIWLTDIALFQIDLDFDTLEVYKAIGVSFCLTLGILIANFFLGMGVLQNISPNKEFVFKTLLLESTIISIPQLLIFTGIVYTYNLTFIQLIKFVFISSIIMYFVTKFVLAYKIKKHQS